MEIKINISEDEIKDIVLQEIANQYHSTYSGDRNLAKRVVAECVIKKILENILESED